MSVSPGKAKRVFKRDGKKCLKCRTEENLTVDHIVPASLGGHDGHTNLQTLCKPCNWEKGLKVKSYRKDKDSQKSIIRFRLQKEIENKVA